MDINLLGLDYKDEILAPSNTQRKYIQTVNTDGTISLQDVTAYSQEGSAYSAKDIIEEREAINEIFNNRFYNLNELEKNSESGYLCDALLVNEVNKYHKTNKVLWSGSIYPKAADTAVLSEKISEQPHGIVIFFQWYGEGTPRAADMICHFIPKYLCTNFAGGYAVSAIDFGGGYAMSKYLYIGDTTITGSDFNGDAAKTTDSGIKITNWNYIMTKIIGV